MYVHMCVRKTYKLADLSLTPPVQFLAARPRGILQAHNIRASLSHSHAYFSSKLCQRTSLCLHNHLYVRTSVCVRDVIRRHLCTEYLCVVIIMIEETTSRPRLPVQRCAGNNSNNSRHQNLYPTAEKSV